MEEQLSSFSQVKAKPENIKAPDKKRRKINGKVVKITLCILLAIAVAIKMIDYCMWPAYNDKYYNGLLKLCSIDEENTLDGMSGWGYAPYEFSDGSRKCTLAYAKPSRGHYTFRVQLDNSGFFTTDYDELVKNGYIEPIKYDNASYSYEVYALVGRSGRVSYKGYIYIGGDEFSGGDPCGFEIKDNDVFEYNYGVPDNYKQIAEKLRPEIMKIKAELENEIIGKLK